MPMNIDDFCNLPLDEQRAILRHPRWKNRCHCKRYGLPWPQVKHLLDGTVGTGSIRHTRFMCAPNDEFIDEARNIIDQ